MNFQQIADSLDTGDLMLFAATFEESKLIELVTGYPFSHCGMVTRLPGDDNVYLLESVGDSRRFPDPIDHKMDKKGVRVVNLMQLLPYYLPFTNNEFTYRKLAADRTEDWQAKFLEFVEQVDGTPFPNDESMIVNYVLGHYRNVKASTNIGTNDTVMYCAQLVAATYLQLGMLPSEVPDNYYAPGDFSSKGQAIPLLEGKLGADLLIHWDKPVKRVPSLAATTAGGS